MCGIVWSMHMHSATSTLPARAAPPQNEPMSLAMLMDPVVPVSVLSTPMLVCWKGTK